MEKDFSEAVAAASQRVSDMEHTFVIGVTQKFAPSPEGYCKVDTRMVISGEKGGITLRDSTTSTLENISLVGEGTLLHSILMRMFDVAAKKWVNDLHPIAPLPVKV